ncbi:S8 family serine peptidase, partial [Arthrobacter sp. GCM10027362]|uniref:S8 family serine peptidase n=1 Tax=Arthrobacter sp. GCM10027362 TaxID=3273379 RepID=UPI003643F4C1
MTEHGASGTPSQRFGLGAGAVSIALLIGSVIPVSIAAAVDGPAVQDQAPAAAVSAAPDRDRFVVKFRDTARLDFRERGTAYHQADRPPGVSVTEVRSTATGARVIETGRGLDDGEAAELIGSLDARPDVEYVGPDTLLRPALVPNDTHFARQWSLSGGQAGLHAPDAWDTSTGRGAVVAVVDTGITTHSDLAANVLPGYDMVSVPDMARDGNGRDGNPRDQGDGCGGAESSWHGTHVAGIIAAAGDNGKGITGVAYGARILPVRAVGACGGYLSDVADAVVWAAGGPVPDAPANPTPAKVINVSLSADGECLPPLQAAIDAARSRGAAVVVAAGNGSKQASESSPANCRNVITVAAATRGGGLAPYSNYGPAVDVTAPGGDLSGGAEGGILSTSNRGTAAPAAGAYAYMAGTSMAAPQVAGLAALLFAAEPALTPAAAEARIRATA